MKKNFFKSLLLAVFVFSFLLCGFTLVTAESATIYPLHFTSSLESYVTEMPNILYNTPASENGLAGNVYSATGIVLDIIPEEETPDGVPLVFSIMTSEAPVYFTVMDPDFVERTTGKDYARDLFDSTMDYTLPEIGEYVTIYGIYSGYSSVYDGPMFYFGIDEFVRDSVVGSSSNNHTSPSPTPSAPAHSVNINDYTLINTEDISSGNYSGTEVALEGVIDQHSSNKYGCDFKIWIISGDSYICDDGHYSSIEEGSPEQVFQNAKDGDVIRFATKIYDDNSFGMTEIFAAEVVGSTDLASVYDSYKSNCPQMDYNGSQRTPDEYEGEKVSVSGTIFQVVNEGSHMAEYIIETTDGLVYLHWYEKEDLRGSRFLEGDTVNVYGLYNGLETYSSLARENTIPCLSVHLIDLA